MEDLKYKCKRCNYAWRGRTDHKPAVCPKCKRYDWDEVKENKNGGTKNCLSNS